MINKLVNLFPVWAILLSLVAYANAELFSSFKAVIIPLLALVMFSMGMTLQGRDFISAFKKPATILLAVMIQFLLMPLFAYGLSRALNLSSEVMTGMVLVGASAGGTASNVICYLAKGNVALSILMTIVSTVFAILLMPALSYFYLNQTVPVPAQAMLQSLLIIVLLPVITGVIVNSIFRRQLKSVQVIFPLLSSLSIVWIIAIIVALNHDNLDVLALPVLIAVVLHNLLGLLVGYGIPWLLKYDESTCRTICIEVAMQNSGLSVALAIKHFSIAAALPGALFSIWHNISGSLLALYWRTKKKIGFFK